MKSTNHLHQIISCLSNKEKNYVRRYCEFVSTAQPKLYVLLFELLSKQKSYDDKEAMFELQLNPKQLAATKNYLHNQIFAALRLFHRSVTQETVIVDYISDAEILIGKGLFELAKNKLSLAKKASKGLHIPHAVVRIRDVEAVLILQEPHELGTKVRLIEKQTIESKTSIEQEGLLYSYQVVIRNLNMNCCHGEQILKETTETIEYLKSKYTKSSNDEYDLALMCASLLWRLSTNNQFDIELVIDKLFQAEKLPKWNLGLRIDIGEALFWAAIMLLGAGEKKHTNALSETLKKWSRLEGESNGCFLAPWHALNLRLSLENEKEETGEAFSLASKFLSGLRSSAGTSNSMLFEIRYWMILTQIRARKYDAALRKIRWYSESPVSFQLSEEMVVAVGLLELVCLFETRVFEQLGNKYKKLVLLIQKCKGLHEHELIFINSMRRVRLFNSLGAERDFYEKSIENVYRSNCVNRYLQVGDKPITVSWLENRFANTN